MSTESQRRGAEVGRFEAEIKRVVCLPSAVPVCACGGEDAGEWGGGSVGRAGGGSPPPPPYRECEPRDAAGTSPEGRWG